MNRTAQSSKSAITTIDDFITKVGNNTKTAAAPLSEPGSIGGETSHPVKSVDDRLQKATEGERSKENTKDVKEDQGKPSVENAAEATAKSASAIMKVARSFAKKAEGGAVSVPGSAEDDQLQIGTKKAPTGEDSSVETSSAKAGKEDPGSSHPARTDNDSLDGHKYAADTPLEKLASDMRDAGNTLCAQLAWLTNNTAPATATKAAAAQTDNRPAAPPAGVTQVNRLDPDMAKQAGWELAGLINGTHDKAAVDAMVQNSLYGVIKQASEDADLFIEFATDYFAKQAEGEPGGEAPPPGGEGGGAPPGAGGGGPDEEAAMMGALGGGEGGGAPPAPGGGMGGDPAGGGADPQAMMLAQVLEHLGVSEEELAQAMAEVQGGGAGGGMGGDPAAGGGAPPPGGGMGGDPAAAGGGGPPPGMEAMASFGGGKQNVQQNVKAAEVAAFIRETVSRSRNRRK